MEHVHALGLQRVGLHAGLVHGNGHAAGTAAFVDLSRLLIARLFHAVELVPAQKLHQQAVEVFRTCSDDDLLRLHRHPPEVVEVPGDGLLQLPAALG